MLIEVNSKKSNPPRGVPQPFNRLAGHTPQCKPVVGRLQTSVSAQSVKRPVAPPVYRPQPVPRVLQPKIANEAIVLKPPKMAVGAPADRTLKAPLVYRPQPKVNAPRSLPAQMKSMSLRAPSQNVLMQPKKAATNMHPHRTSRVIQRVIVIAGKEYGLANKEEFENTYPSNERVEMWNAIRAVKGRPDTIDQTLEVPRRFKLVREDLGKHGVSFYVKYADPFVEKLEGEGFTREAAKRPILVTRPERGFEELRIEGLVSCVAIIIEAKLKGMVQAAAGSHFLTPKRVSENKLNVKGSQLLENQLAMVKSAGPYDSLSAILVHSFEDTQESTKAVNLITSFLGSKSVEATTFQKKPTSVKYRLKADGEGIPLFG